MSALSSPKLAQRILSWFCDEQWLDELLGDLEEDYLDNLKLRGKRRARINYYLQVIQLIRPHILKKYNETQNTPFMLRNYIKSAYRNLTKNKVYSAINVSGLSVGIACCIMISLYVYDELSYDRFFQDSDRIYRVALERVYPSNTRYFGSSPVNLAPTILENYPEVESAGRIHRLFFQNQVVVDFGDRSFIEENYLFADANFFKVFSFEFVEGEAGNALDEPDKVILSESTAHKYFGQESAIGKTYRIDTNQYMVAAVIKDVPTNSHMSFDILGSIHSLPFLEQAAETNSWINPWLYTYIKLRDDMDASGFEAKLPQLVESYGLASILRQLQISEEDYPESGNEFNYFLQPVVDIHLHSNLDTEMQANSNVMYVHLLIGVVLFILLISCINFVNLATARSAERAKEVGVRKVMGGTRILLIKQFLTESVLISLMSMIIAVFLVYLLIPSFNVLVSKSLSIATLSHPLVFSGLFIFMLLVGVLAGLYPALVISSINSALVLKGKYQTSGKGVWLRNSLIVFQFLISISMIAGTLLLGDQMDYIRNKNLGFNKENVLVIEQAQALETNERQQAFMNNLRQLSGVNSVAASFAVPGNFLGNTIFQPDIPDSDQIRTFTNTIDDEYISTLSMEVLAGRGFRLDFNDSLNVIINETTAKETGYADPIGQKLLVPNAPEGFPTAFNIVGVVKDFHHQSLHQKIPAMVLFNINNGGNFTLPVISVKFSGDNTLQLLQQIERSWEEVVSEQPFTYSFLNDNLDALYEADRQTGKVFSLFTIVVIIMACVGLFGLAAYVTQQRTKEIGVRKVLGASIGSIILLLSKDFTKLVAIAFALSVPLVYWGMSEWLQNFAYRTGINATTIIASGALTLILALLTISYYSIKIALLNPVKSLRSE